MDLWPKSPPVRQHPKGFCLPLERSVWMWSLGPPTPSRCAQGDTHGVLQHLPLPLWLWLSPQARHAASSSSPLEGDAQKLLTLKNIGEKLPSALLCLKRRGLGSQMPVTHLKR